MCPMGDALFAIFLGAMTGATVGLCTCAFWLALNIPLRVQAIFDAGTPKVWAAAITVGLLLAGLRNGTSFSLNLPEWVGVLVMLTGGVFVGMLASALAEALDVLPSIWRRLHIASNIRYATVAMMLGKTLGTILAALLHQ